MVYKALSIKQPWANLIAVGQKTIETRRWATDYRGPLLIVSSKTPALPPAGFALALADLVDCRRMTIDDEHAARCSVYEGAYAWLLTNVRPIQPVAVTGQLGIYDLDIEVVFAANVRR